MKDVIQPIQRKVLSLYEPNCVMQIHPFKSVLSGHSIVKTHFESSSNLSLPRAFVGSTAQTACRCWVGNVKVSNIGALWDAHLAVTVSDVRRGDDSMLGGSLFNARWRRIVGGVGGKLIKSHPPLMFELSWIF